MAETTISTSAFNLGPATTLCAMGQLPMHSMNETTAT